MGQSYFCRIEEAHVHDIILGRNRKRREKERRKVMDKFTKKLVRVVLLYFVFAVIVTILFQTVWMISLIPSESMAGTIEVGDVVISSRIDISNKDIERYDILIFIPPDEPDVTYIKRVVGLPGETIEVSNGKIYADGVELVDSFVQAPMNRYGDGIYEVPDGCYFFLGDNRNNSKDSRFWEKKYVPIGNIQAKAKFILFPFSDAKEL